MITLIKEFIDISLETSYLAENCSLLNKLPPISELALLCSLDSQPAYSRCRCWCQSRTYLSQMALANRHFSGYLTSPITKGRFQSQGRRQAPTSSNPPNTCLTITQPATPWDSYRPNYTYVHPNCIENTREIPHLDTCNWTQTVVSSGEVPPTPPKLLGVYMTPMGILDTKADYPLLGKMG